MLVHCWQLYGEIGGYLTTSAKYSLKISHHKTRCCEATQLPGLQENNSFGLLVHLVWLLGNRSCFLYFAF